MNIFYIHTDPKICAQQHNNTHSNKMCTEYAQLMSTAHRVLDGEKRIGLTQSGRRQQQWFFNDKHKDDLIYKASHVNHPSNVWTRHSHSNYNWLYEMWCHLLDEYTYRYGKIHGCSKLKDILKECPKNIRQGEFTQPTPAMPDEFIVKDSVESYRMYYNKAKSHIGQWKNRSVPEWYTGV